MSTIEPSSSIRSFYRRRGHVRQARLDAYERLYPVYGVDRQRPPSLPEIFRRGAPVVLEIGSGMGDATVEMAAADPDRDYLAVEVHVPGIANLLEQTEARELTNLRVFEGDAVSLARSCLPADALDAIHVFFPDPWPKVRHHKRRLIGPQNVALLRSRLRPGGAIHLATDWEHYAEAMLEVLDAEPGLANAHDGFAPRPSWRPVTKFERRGVAEGRAIFDLEFVRPNRPLSLGILARMAPKPWSRIAVGVGLVAIFASGVLAPVWMAVDGTIALATTEPVHVTDVNCVTTSVGRNSSYCTGSWTLPDGSGHRERLSSDWFVSDGDTFDGYGNQSTAAPTRLFWLLAQLLYAIPIGIVIAFIRFHRKRLAGAGAPIRPEDEAAMNARAADLRRRADPSSDALSTDLSTGPRLSTAPPDITGGDHPVRGRLFA